MELKQQNLYEKGLEHILLLVPKFTRSFAISALFERWDKLRPIQY